MTIPRKTNIVTVFIIIAKQESKKGLHYRKVPHFTLKVKSYVDFSFVFWH